MHDDITSSQAVSAFSFCGRESCSSLRAMHCHWCQHVRAAMAPTTAWALAGPSCGFEGGQHVCRARRIGMRVADATFEAGHKSAAYAGGLQVIESRLAWSCRNGPAATDCRASKQGTWQADASASTSTSAATMNGTITTSRGEALPMNDTRSENPLLMCTALDLSEQRSQWVLLLATGHHAHMRCHRFRCTCIGTDKARRHR